MQHVAARAAKRPIPDHGATSGSLRNAILSKLRYAMRKSAQSATDRDWYMATVLALRDRIVDVWSNSRSKQPEKRIYYLSIEFLIGRLLFDAIINLDLEDVTRNALSELGVNFDRLREMEPDAALGNGGLGRLAACFMDSMSALAIPAYGYGIRYEHGLFEQRIHEGWQREFAEDWLSHGNPWEFPRADISYSIGFGGTVEYSGGDDSTARATWSPAETVLAVPYDTPIAGWRGRHVNALRLWSARSAEPLQDAAFNQREGARPLRGEAISRFLYPNDSTAEGRELRLRQEYFFTAASLQDLLRRHRREFGSLASLPEHAAVQLNDTHPAIAVAELMRLLVDENGFSWADAWKITRRTLSYTNHTLLPEALESWTVELIGRLLPRHLQIIYQINWYHLEEVNKSGRDAAFLREVSLIEEGEEKRVRMAHLAFLGCHCVNGVSQLHSDLLRETVFHNLAQVSATRIVNKTNGISFRRWLYAANRPLTGLLVDTLGQRVLDDPGCMREIQDRAGDHDFVASYSRARQINKTRLAALLHARTGIHVQPDALFDVHVKRVHEYKRQLLNILETIALYHGIRARPNAGWVPRVKIFAGKAAASYERAKLIIKLANDVSGVINADPVVGDRLKVVFVPNYGASLAEEIIPAADVSEQISTAGMEASGTGNMKLALNGAITIGTEDGANIEIREHVGSENLVIFGMTAAEVSERREQKLQGSDIAGKSARLAHVIQSLASGEFSEGDRERFAPIVRSLLDYDRFMVAADFDAYWEAQRSIDELWRRPADWWRASILNTAHMAWFSSDRAIREYATDIWQIAVN